MLQALLHLEQRITTAQSADVIVLKAVQLELSITLTFDLYQAKHYIGNYGHATSESFRKWARSLGISMPSEDDVDTPDESAIYSEKGHSLPCCLPPKTSQGFASRKNSGSENSKPRSGCLYARLSETKWEDSDFEKGKREWLDYLDQRELGTNHIRNWLGRRFVRGCNGRQSGEYGNILKIDDVLNMSK